MPKFKSNEFMFSAGIELSCVNKYMNRLSAAGVESFVVLDEKMIRDLSGASGGGINQHIIEGEVNTFKGSVLSADPSLSAIPPCLVLTYRQFNNDALIQETWNRRGTDTHKDPCIKNDPGVISSDWVGDCKNLNYNHADLSGSRYDSNLSDYLAHFKAIQIGKVYSKNEIAGDKDLEYWKTKADTGWMRIQEYLSSGRQIK